MQGDQSAALIEIKTNKAGYFLHWNRVQEEKRVERMEKEKREIGEGAVA